MMIELLVLYRPTQSRPFTLSSAGGAGGAGRDGGAGRSCQRGLARGWSGCGVRPGVGGGGGQGGQGGVLGGHQGDLVGA